MGVLDTEGLRRVWGKIAAALDSLSEKLKNHNHDSRYYTEAEMDSKLNGKAAADHNHDNRYFTETEINNTLMGCLISGNGRTLVDGGQKGPHRGIMGFVLSRMPQVVQMAWTV